MLLNIMRRNLYRTCLVAAIASFLLTSSVGRCETPSAYQQIEDEYEAAIEKAETEEAIAAEQAAYAAKLFKLARRQRGSDATQGFLDSSLYYSLAGDNENAEKAVAVASKRATGWSSKVLLIQTLDLIPGESEKARGLALELKPQASKNAGRARELQLLFDQLGLSEESTEIAVIAQNLRKEAATRRAAAALGYDPIPINETVFQTGEPISLEQYKGKVVLLDFWATWCGPCIRELPNVKKVYKDFHDEGFEIVGVSLDKSKKTLETFLKKNDMPWPQIADGKGWQARVAKQYDVHSIPMTYLINREGKVVLGGKKDNFKLRGSRLYEAVEDLVRG